MSSGLNDLYQQLILDHNKSPRNFRKIEKATHNAEGYNPLCGDHFTVFLDIDGDVIKDVSFSGLGMRNFQGVGINDDDSGKGNEEKEDAEKLFEKFRSVVTRDIHKEIDDLEELGCLGALAGVAEFPARIKCASLAWHALHSALNSNGAIVSTEIPNVQ